MQFLTTRIRAISIYVAERWKRGLPVSLGNINEEAIFILDGVGGFQFAPLAIRRALRETSSGIGTIYYRWQFGLMGEIWTDLCWLRRNRVMGARLARRMLAFRRQHPNTKIHLIAFSGGAGVAAFALESLKGRPIVDTLLLACPALSPEYDMSRALSSVQRAYALISRRDRVILGLGTRLFGTTDRQFKHSAGLTGFRIPKATTNPQTYERLKEIYWTPDLKALGQSGGHTGWVSVPFLRRHLLAILRGEPSLATCAVRTA